MVLAVEQCQCLFTGGFVWEHASDYETTLHCATPVTGAVSMHNNPVLQLENQNTGHRCSLSNEAVRAKSSAFISEVFVRELQASALLRIALKDKHITT
jgi:hypothetical protein